MALVANPTVNGLFKRIGKGDVYLATYPTADPGTGTLASTIDGFYGLFYQDAAAKKVLKAGVKVLCETTSGGLQLKIKPATVEFEPNNGPKQKVTTGIEEATGEFSFYDADSAHLAHLFGVDATQLLSVASAAGKAGRKIAALSPSASNQAYVIMFRMPSILVPGEFDHVLLPCVRIIPELDIKLSMKDKVEAKANLSLVPDIYAKGADGSGIVFVVDNADAAGL